MKKNKLAVFLAVTLIIGQLSSSVVLAETENVETDVMGINEVTESDVSFGIVSDVTENEEFADDANNEEVSDEEYVFDDKLDASDDTSSVDGEEVLNTEDAGDKESERDASADEESSDNDKIAEDKDSDDKEKTTEDKDEEAKNLIADYQVEVVTTPDAAYITLMTEDTADGNLWANMWSKKDGKDDIRSAYFVKQEDGSYILAMPAFKFVNKGTFYLKIYDGTKYIGTETFSWTDAIVGPKLEIATSPDEISVTYYTYYAPEISFNAGIWSKKSGQDDLRWRNLVKVGDGTYSATFPAYLFNNKNTFYLDLYDGSNMVESTQFYWSEAVVGPRIEVSGAPEAVTITYLSGDDAKGNLHAAIWSKKSGQDDLRWTNFTRKSTGVYELTSPAYRYNNKNTFYIDIYDGSALKISTQFTWSNAKVGPQLNLSVSDTKTVVEYKSGKGPQGNLHSAVWSDKNGQDDIIWTSFKKQSNEVYTMEVPSGKFNDVGIFHMDTYDGNTLIDSRTFDWSNAILGYYDGQLIYMDPSWQFAGNTSINSGAATFYRATNNRKNITVAVNAGHGTVGGEYQWNLSHPDGTPKVTGGSTAAGAIWTQSDNSGMTFYDGTLERDVTYELSWILKDKLIAEGYDVVMLRSTQACYVDVITRTVIANNTADCHISLHFDGDGLPYDKGAIALTVPDGIKYMYPTSSIWQKSDYLGSCLLTGLASVGRPIYGSMQMDLMQTSYSSIPSMDIELGNAATPHDRATLSQIANGLVAGVNVYFK